MLVYPYESCEAFILKMNYIYNVEQVYKIGVQSSL